MTNQVCSVHGCPELAPCRIHARVSSRNHRGISRQARGYGRGYELARRDVLGQACALQLEGCTGTADTAQHTDEGQLVPACSHCNFADGARRMRATLVGVS